MQKKIKIENFDSENSDSDIDNEEQSAKVF